MRQDKALEIIKRAGQRRYRPASSRRAMAAFTYQPPAVGPRWTWESATPSQRAAWVRRNRELGVMDWHLCDLFNLTPDGLAAIVRGKDWEASFDAIHEQRTT